MINYCIELYRRSDLCAENDFWRLVSDYHGMGGSDSSEDNKILGEFYRLFIESDKPLILNELESEFSNLSIIGLINVPLKS